MALHGSGAVHCSRDVKIVPDTTIAEASKAAPYDVVVMPGGANGAKNLAAVNYSSFISLYIIYPAVMFLRYKHLFSGFCGFCVGENFDTLIKFGI